MALFLLLTGIGFGLFLVGMAGVVWAVRSGQLDDLDTPPWRMLGDDRPTPDQVSGAPPHA